MSHVESGNATAIPDGAGTRAGHRESEEKYRGGGSATLGGNSTSATIKKAEEAIARAAARLKAKAEKST